MAISRRQFCEGLMIGGSLAGTPALGGAHAGLWPQPAATRTGSDLGSLYPFVQAQADRSRFELSLLHPEFSNLRRWQETVRARILEHLYYAPSRVPQLPQVIRRTDKGDYVEELLTFQTTPDLRVPAFVLVPKKAKLPAPGVVVLHSHDGIYLWGKEKVVEDEREHPYLTAFKQRSYGSKSIASELARQGYVVMAIDMFYWGALEGVKMAFDKIARCYAKAGAPDRSRCRLYDAPHEFNLDMQTEAWEWFRRWL